jgi:hypothetical protein
MAKVTFDSYILKVKRNLKSRADKHKERGVFKFSRKQVDDNLDYFERCQLYGETHIEALLGFRKYLNDKGG